MAPAGAGLVRLTCSDLRLLPTPHPAAEHQKKQKALGSCELCFESERFKKHLLLSLGDKICLMLPERGSLCDGHCLLVPTRHVSGSRMLDEDEYDELKMFQRCLVDMFAEQDRDVVFLESVQGLSRHPHSAIHCVPLKRDDGAMAPMFFKVGREGEGGGEKAWGCSNRAGPSGPSTPSGKGADTS